jgi:hypothetical protein
MNLDFRDRRLFFNPSSLGLHLSHCANPLIVPFMGERLRLFFNSRDRLQRSDIYSVEIDKESLRPIMATFRLEVKAGAGNHFGLHGISLGSHFKYGSQSLLATMGWCIEYGKHWHGVIGRVYLNNLAHVCHVDSTPWIDLNTDDPISMSYPAVFSDSHELLIWYGSTVTWDAGNSEMLHILKESTTVGLSSKILSARHLPYVLGSAQAFARPSIIKIMDRLLMAYSFRGAQQRYSIGFVWLDDLNTATHLNGLSGFFPAEESWENEMVEYPFLFVHKEEVYMLYNGNSFGQSGIGITRIVIER